MRKEPCSQVISLKHELNRKVWCEMEERLKRPEYFRWTVISCLCLLFLIVLFGPQMKVFFTWAWHLYKGVAQEVGNLSEIITAIVAFSAIIVAIRQIWFSNRATALDTYREYLRLAINNPKESRPDKQNSKVDINNPAYDAFVTYLLFAAEEVLNQFPKDKRWRHALKLDLSHHRDFYKSPAFKEDIKSYIPQLQDLIKEILLEEVLFEQRNEKEKSPQAGAGIKG